MRRFGFAIDNRACIGCHACTVACKAEHSVPIGVNRTWVKYIEKGEFPQARRFFSVQRCNHCENAPCVEICPVTSLYTRPDGIVDFNPDRCIGCKACMQACPYDALYLDPDSHTAAKCNYCTHRVDAGLEPACVVVCPVEAIVSGDLDDPQSRISLLDRTQRVQYPKPEKATRPKLFYVGGETAALDPAAAPPNAQYLWSGTDTGISPGALGDAQQEADGASRARRVYDVNPKQTDWGWMVSAYITTKAVAAGAILVPFLQYLFGRSTAAVPAAAAAIAFAFLTLTGLLLVADLKQPRRFLYVLFRPQWKSWLVRGAYLITAFALLVPIAWLASAMGARRSLQLALGGLTAVMAVAVAAYTALLLAQAKGRDYWQNPLLAVGMVLDALIAGAAIVALPAKTASTAAPIASETASLLGSGIALLAGMLLAEFLTRHQTKNAALTARIILRGPFRLWFWGGGVVIGLLAPAAVLASGGSLRAAALLLLVGIAARNHVLVQAPQRIPLS